jgi:hypothetical protein
MVEETMKSNFNFSVYSNEKAEFIDLTWENSNISDFEVELYDSKGKLVMKNHVFSDYLSKEIEMTNKKKGYYIFKIIKDNKVNTYKITKK